MGGTRGSMIQGAVTGASPVGSNLGRVASSPAVRGKVFLATF